MIEIEQMDDDLPPRQFNPHLIGIRNAMIEQSSGSKWMLAKQHIDDMMRVSRLRRFYYWSKIKDTPFTVIVSYPESYGQSRAQYNENEITKLVRKGSNILGLFKKQNFRIHPNWWYCRNVTDVIEDIKLGNISESSLYTPEELFEDFIEKFEKKSWHDIWLSSEYECDESLMKSIINDAKLTEWFSNDFFSLKDKGGSLMKKYIVSVVFLATHSGLTRFKDLIGNNR